ncbi:MAG: hypothetical protein GY715_19285 [Planctomycetes bacterium]|nr:hypothetical protein [Planctomycetota bacterium]
MRYRSPRTITAALLTAIASLTVAAGPASSDDRTGDALDRALDQLAQLDEVRVTVELHDESIARVLDDLASSCPVPLRADWVALDRLGIAPRDRVSIDLASAPLATALAGVALQIGDGLERPVIESHGGYIVLTTTAATAAMVVTDVYDVRDLVTDEIAVEALRAAAPAIPEADEEAPADPEPSTRPSGGEPVGDEPGDAPPEAAPPGDGPAGFGALPLPDLETLRDAPPSPPRSPAGELMALIAEHVDPEGWVDLGGDRTSLTDRGGLVLVTAPPSVHRRFRDAVARLRSARRGAVSVEAAVVDLPRAELAGFTRRYDLTSARLARAVLHARAASVRWRTTSAAIVDRELLIESREGEGIHIAVRMMPRFDETAGTLTVELEVETRHEDDRRSLRTTVPIRPRDGGAVLELPAGTAGETARLFVLIPR